MPDDGDENPYAKKSFDESEEKKRDTVHTSQDEVDKLHRVIDEMTEEKIQI